VWILRFYSTLNGAIILSSTTVGSVSELILSNILYVIEFLNPIWLTIWVSLVYFLSLLNLLKTNLYHIVIINYNILYNNIQLFYYFMAYVHCISSIAINQNRSCYTIMAWRISTKINWYLIELNTIIYLVTLYYNNNDGYLFKRGFWYVLLLSTAFYYICFFKKIIGSTEQVHV